MNVRFTSCGAALMRGIMLLFKSTSKLTSQCTIACDALIQLLPQMADLFKKLEDLLRRETETLGAFLSLHCILEEVLVEGQFVLEGSDLLLAAR